MLINIKGLQKDAENESENVELLTEGTFYKEKEKYYLVYKETEVTGMEGTTTTVEIENQKVAIIRNGVVNNQLLFIPNKKTTSYYNTQFGSLTVSVISSNVKVDVGDEGGNLDISYRMDINDEFANESSLSINIKEA